MNFLGGHRKNGLFFEVFILNIRGLFLDIKIQNWNIYLGLLTFNYLFWYA